MSKIPIPVEYSTEELQDVSEFGIQYLMNGQFSEFQKNEVIATVMDSLHQRLKRIENASEVESDSGTDQNNGTGSS